MCSLKKPNEWDIFETGIFRVIRSIEENDFFRFLRISRAFSAMGATRPASSFACRHYRMRGQPHRLAYNRFN